MFRIALAQVNPTVGDFAGNLELLGKNISRAREAGASLVVFPELAVTGYPPEDLLFQPSFIRENLRLLDRLAGETKGCLVLAGFAEHDAAGLYNSCAVIADGSVRGIYRKQNLPNYGVFDEKRYFLAGSQNRIFQAGTLRFAVNICEDIWSRSGPGEEQAAAGCRLMVNISASPFEAGKSQRRERMLSERAAHYGVFLAYLNMVGGQDEIVFDGRSAVFDPAGRLVARAASFKEDILFFDLEETALSTEKTAAGKLPVTVIPPGPSRSRPVKPMPARLEEAPEEVAGIYRALVTGTRDYVLKNGFREVAVGLSGGLDSALVAMVAADSLGPEKVHAIYMPGPYSSAVSDTDSRRLAEAAGVDYRVIPINRLYASYRELLEPVLGEKASGSTWENIQARVRGNILMAFSNRFGWLVLTTGNKSETATGYSTMYGDSAGGLAVLKDVPKTMVYRLAGYRNSIAPLIPARTMRRAPSAELRPGQKDSDSLPPYRVLDPILRARVEENLSLEDIIGQGHPPGAVGKALSLLENCEYKRRQAPPGIKVTPRAFGRDWRLPLTNRFREAGKG